MCVMGCPVSGSCVLFVLFSGVPRTPDDRRVRGRAYMRAQGLFGEEKKKAERDSKKKTTVPRKLGYGARVRCAGTRALCARTHQAHPVCTKAASTHLLFVLLKPPICRFGFNPFQRQKRERSGLMCVGATHPCWCVVYTQGGGSSLPRNPRCLPRTTETRGTAAA